MTSPACNTTTLPDAGVPNYSNLRVGHVLLNITSGSFESNEKPTLAAGVNRIRLLFSDRLHGDLFTLILKDGTHSNLKEFDAIITPTAAIFIMRNGKMHLTEHPEGFTFNEAESFIQSFWKTLLPQSSPAPSDLCTEIFKKYRAFKNECLILEADEVGASRWVTELYHKILRSMVQQASVVPSRSKPHPPANQKAGSLRWPFSTRRQTVPVC